VPGALLLTTGDGSGLRSTNYSMAVKGHVVLWKMAAVWASAVLCVRQTLV